jgi:hypothetical protein
MELKRAKNRVLAWLIAAFMVPPVVWLGAGTYINIWSVAELVKILLSPFIWIYILVYLGLTVFAISRALNSLFELLGRVDTLDDDELHRGIDTINRIPSLFFILMSIYCVVGPNVALLGQTLGERFLDGFEYLLANLLGIPLILLFTIPFFIEFIRSLEAYTSAMNVSGTKRFLNLRAKLLISFLLNIIGALLTLVITGLAILNKTDTSAVVEVFTVKFLVVGAIVLVISAVNLALTEGQITRPVQELTLALSEIFTVFSRGQGSLVHEIKITSRDELGYISRRFNTFMETLNGIIRQVQTLAVESNRTSEELIRLSTNARSAVENAENSSQEIMSLMERIAHRGRREKVSRVFPGSPPVHPRNRAENRTPERGDQQHFRREPEDHPGAFRRNRSIPQPPRIRAQGRSRVGGGPAFHRQFSEADAQYTAEFQTHR